MCEIHQSYRALAALKVRQTAQPIEQDTTARAKDALYYANALVGAAENEAIKAELAMADTSLTPQEAVAFAEAVEAETDIAAIATELIDQQRVLWWRVTRLQRALTRAVTDKEADPILAAASDAAALATALLGYRETRELAMHLDESHPQNWHNLPLLSLGAAAKLLANLTSTVERLLR